MTGTPGTTSSDAVVVTGAARGLGRAIADRYRAAGATVVGLDVTVPDDVPFEIVPTDITDRDAVDRAFDHITQTVGAPTVGVNAAGIYPRTRLAEFSVDTYRKMFDVNVLGTWLVAAAFSRHARRGAVLLNVGSVDAVTPAANLLLYAASKAAVHNLTRGMAGELAESGIRCIGIAPANMATEGLLEAAGQIGADAAAPARVAEVVWRLTTDGGFPLVNGQIVEVRLDERVDD